MKARKTQTDKWGKWMNSLNKAKENQIVKVNK